MSGRRTIHGRVDEPSLAEEVGHVRKQHGDAGRRPQTRPTRSPVPERVRWAVELLDVQPGDRVLEIGCGSGSSAALVCERLTAGEMLAIDRSPTQIERARRRNEAQLASGRLSFQMVELADLDVGDAWLDTVFAINVNLFWLGPARAEIDAVRRTLSPGGRLFLFYETPGPEQARHAAGRIPAVLRPEGFVEPEWLTRTPTLFGCVTALRS
jgi:cyclopropane fatty-acyl-phospholipid synthase-like methyltransferase